MDAMRATMMVAGVFFHAGLAYRAGYGWRFSDPSESAFFVWLTEFLHAFRMPAFFAVAGFFCAMTFGRDAGMRKLGTRLMVFGVPFLVMVLSVQPLHFAGFDAPFWRSYFHDGEYISHLWFLINLSVYYVAAWMCLFLPRLPGYANAFLFRYKTALSAAAFLLCVPLIVLLDEISIGKGYEASTLVEYAPFFIVGYVIFRSPRLFEEFRRPRLLDVAVMAVLAVLFYRQLGGAAGRVVSLMAFYQCGFVLTGLCVLLFSRFLDRKYRLTRLVSDSAYTIYLLHHILVVAFATWLASALPHAGAALKYCIVVGAVLALTILIHQLLIARFALLRFLFNGRAVGRLNLKLFQELLLELQHRLRIRERFARHQEHVLDAVAQSIDARRLQVDAVAGEGARHPVQQPGPVGGHDR
jgi:glucan biosynthesis protein C